MVAGGSLRDEYFDKSTSLLIEANEIVMAKLGDNNRLWQLINTAEKALTRSGRREYIFKASESFEKGLWYNFSFY